MAGVAQGLIGSLKAASAAAELPAGTILFLWRPSGGITIPSGWTSVTSIGGNPVQGYAVRGSTTYGRNTGTPGILSFSFPTNAGTVPGGSHVVPAPAQTFGPGPTAGPNGQRWMAPVPVVASVAGGDHLHATPTGTKGPFVYPSTPNNPSPGTAQVFGVGLAMMTTATPQPKVPRHAIVWSGTTTNFPNTTRVSVPAPFDGAPGTNITCGMWSVAPTTWVPLNNVSFRFPDFSALTTPGGVVLSGSTFLGNLTPGGSHSHPASAGFGQAITGSSQQMISQSLGDHFHGPTTFPMNGNHKWWSQFTHVTPLVNTTQDIDVVSGMIVMYNSSVIPDGWLLCDGNNGTPNLIDQFIGYDNAVPNNSAPVVIGQDAFGSVSSTPTTPIAQGYFDKTPGPSTSVVKAGGLFAGPWTGVDNTGMNTWRHGHSWPTFRNPAVIQPAATGGHGPGQPGLTPSWPTAYGAHEHSIMIPKTNPYTMTITQKYIPPHVQVVFIQKA